MITFRRGTSRGVLCVGPIAIKLARNKRGARCNRHEFELYRRTTEWRRSLLCPVLWCSENGAILIARAAKPMTQEEFNDLYRRNELPDWDYLAPANDREPCPIEGKASDWGWLNGKPLAVDYAEPFTVEEANERPAGSLG
jgi:hypothetical protein